jgi:hypothetical protein
MKRCAAISTMILSAVMTWVSPVAAQDVIGYWNELAVAAASQAAPAGRGATPATVIDVAIVQLAMHDVDARIYLGIHFRFADIEGRGQGRRVAGFVFRNFLEPID